MSDVDYRLLDLGDRRVLTVDGRQHVTTYSERVVRMLIERKGPRRAALYLPFKQTRGRHFLSPLFRYLRGLGTGGLSVLEVGCSFGHITECLAEEPEVAELYTFDTDPAFVAITRAKVEELGLKAVREVAGFTNEETCRLPYADARFDLVLAIGVVEHLPARNRRAQVDEYYRVLARGGHVIFVIKGNQPRTYQALNDIGWEQIPIAAATFEADRGRIETRTIQVAPAPEGLKYPDMKQASLIERYTTFKDKKGKTVTRSETVLVLTTASPDQAPPADLLALNRGHWAATEATHWIRDTDLKEDSSQARAPGSARFMATAGNTVLSLLRIHGVTNIAAERRLLSGSDGQILKRMGLSTG